MVAAASRSGYRVTFDFVDRVVRRSPVASTTPTIIEVRMIAAVALTLLLAGCSASAAAPRATAAAPAAGQVNVALTEMKIVTDRASIAAGQVTFVVRNDGTVVHELEVLRTDLAADRIPASPADPAKADETGLRGMSGVLQPGERKTFTVALDAARYVLICDTEGHYLAGMSFAFTVN
jgi:uncharacterized cupredoxin-like copper-binding protein